jgi:hypothetical protein
MTHVNPSKQAQTLTNKSKCSSEPQHCMKQLQNPSKDLHVPPTIFGWFTSIWDDPHQCRNHLYTSYIDPEQPNLNRDRLVYIATQGLYIVWGLARGTLENSLWFSLASIRPSGSDHKVALTEEFSPFGGLKVPRYQSQQISI